jgi:hypothetical protein
MTALKKLIGWLDLRWQSEGIKNQSYLRKIKMSFMSAIVIRCDTQYCMSEQTYVNLGIIPTTIFEIKENLKLRGWRLPEDSIDKTYCEKCVKEGRVAIKNI